jgi:seryl-tRNA synthetase
MTLTPEQEAINRALDKQFNPRSGNPELDTKIDKLLADRVADNVVAACCIIIQRELTELQVENNRLEDELGKEKVKNIELRQEQQLRKLHDEIRELKAKVSRLEVDNGLLREKLQG